MATAQREHKVLEALIRLFIERREPVSSRMLEESGALDIKSASIRSVLGELERKGYLQQPHSSSGRVPTDDGYRAYVNGLLEPESLTDETRREVERALKEAGEDLEQILRATARILGRFSHNIAILAGPVEHSPRINGVELYQRDSTHVLVMVSLESGAARTELVQLDRAMKPESLIAASSYLADRLAGHSLDDTRRTLDELLRGPGDATEDLARDVAHGARTIFDADRLLRLTFEGVSEALEQPEFGDPSRLKALLELMSRAEELQRALENFACADTGEVQLAIGRENALPILHPFSLLATRYELSERYGYLAILGPRRMPYARAMALIRLIASHLDELRR